MNIHINWDDIHVTSIYVSKQELHMHAHSQRVTDLLPHGRSTEK